MQSANRKMYSTETAILKIHNDILRAMDRGECTLLVMLDLSAAFDTGRPPNPVKTAQQHIQHQNTHIQHQNTTVSAGLNHTSTFVTKQVMIDCALSGEKMVNYDLPQGSILGADFTDQ